MGDISLNIGYIKVPRGVEDIYSIDVVEKLNLGRLSNYVRRKVTKALKTGVAPVEHGMNGKLSSVYSMLCKMHNLPEAYLSEQSKGLYIEGVNDAMWQELEVMHKLTRDAHDDPNNHYRQSDYYHTLHRYSNYNNSGDVVSAYTTNLKPDNLAQIIARHRPLDQAAVDAAVAMIRDGAVITKTYTNMTT